MQASIRTNHKDEVRVFRCFWCFWCSRGLRCPGGLRCSWGEGCPRSLWCEWRDRCLGCLRCFFRDRCFWGLKGRGRVRYIRDWWLLEAGVWFARRVLQFHVYLFIYFSSVKSLFPSRVCGTTSWYGLLENWSWLWKWPVLLTKVNTVSETVFSDSRFIHVLESNIISTAFNGWQLHQSIHFMTRQVMDLMIQSVLLRMSQTLDASFFYADYKKAA